MDSALIQAFKSGRNGGAWYKKDPDKVPGRIRQVKQFNKIFDKAIYLFMVGCCRGRALPDCRVRSLQQEKQDEVANVWNLYGGRNAGFIGRRCGGALDEPDLLG
jgi:hypothetical protein